jgi:aminobenzoyl-glutamate utilization protein B
VVPSEASIWYYFREVDYPVRALHALGDTMAMSAAAMTSTSWDQRIIGSAWEQTHNRPLAEAVHANMLAVGMPRWSDADQRFARAVQRSMGSPETGLHTGVSRELQDYGGSGTGSDDVGDMSWNVPTVRMNYPANMPEMTGHHWSSAIAVATPIAHQGANYGCRALAMTALDLFLDADLLPRAKRYFTEVQTKERQWVSLIPEGTPPPIDLNEDRMRNYRPLLEKLRYDPTRYDTYLEQLGVAYPTLAKPREPQGGATLPD